MRRLFFLFFILTIAFNQLLAKDLSDIVVNESANGVNLVYYLNTLKKNFDVDFIFEENELNAYTIQGVTRDYDIDEFLDVFLRGHYIIKYSNQILLIINQNQFGSLALEKSNYIILKDGGEDQININGIITDINTKDPIENVDIVIPSLDKGTKTNASGDFSLVVPKGIYKVDIQYIGYQASSFILAFSPYSQNSEINTSIFPSFTELENVTIMAEGENSNLRSQITGVERLSMETIKAIPTFMGVVDPIRSITTLPGVSTAGELTSGFNVRGGDTGQNLILQDGATIYNPTHLFGFFSAFNPDMVNDLELYKGGGPASFGGRAASVLDLNLKNGNINHHSFSGGVGLVSSRLLVEGPILRNKLSYAVGGRGSYSNWLIHTVNNEDLKKSNAKFYDVTAKLTFRPNQNDFVSISGYLSYDDFNFASDSLFSWGTKNISLNWDHIFSPNLSGTLIAANSNYKSNVSNDTGADSFIYENSIQNYSFKYALLFNSYEKLKVNAGIESEYSNIEPGKIKPTVESGNIQPEDVSDQHALTVTAFIQGDYKVSERLGISAGLRYTHFFRLGEATIYDFDYENLNGRYPSIIDTTYYSSGQVVSNYGGFEPRVSMRYMISTSTAIKASYYKTYQYLQFISNTLTPTPLDYWIACGPYIKPVSSDQYTFGVFQNLQNEKYEISVEGFYKNIRNEIDYIEGSDLVLNESLEAGLSQGFGKAYGIEFQLKKNANKLYGWISYTYSRSLRKFESEIPILNLNNGSYYPSIYDQPHNLSVIGNYKFSPRTTFSLSFTYKSGRPITIPVSKYSYTYILSVLNYSDRNEYKMPDYNRLDLSLTVEGKQKRDKRFMGEWVFSIYNVYGRKNAYAIYFDATGYAHKLSILGSIFPSISYNFKF